MGTIGTGQADGAAEQNPAEAWRSRNLVVLLANGSSLGIQGGSITDASASHLHLVGRFVWTEPCVGELLQLSEASGLPRVQQDLMVTKVLQTPDRDADAAADGAAKEETAAAEQTSATDEAGDWRTKNLLVHFEARHQLLRWVHVEGGRIKRCNPQADADLFVGLEVLRYPTVGASLWFKWRTGEGGLVESPICAVLEYGEEAEVAATEETAAAPEAEQPAAADGEGAKSANQKMDPLVSAFIDVGLCLRGIGSLKGMQGAVRAFVGTASLIETMGGTAEVREISYRLMISKITGHSFVAKRTAEGSAAHVG